MAMVYDLSLISEGARQLLARLNRVGQAYLVGGAVRDLILGRQINDEDIACSLTPDQVKAVCSDCYIVDTGIKFGGLSIRCEGRFYEVTSFRSDGLYLDRRRPSEVHFGQSLDQDLARRDFTINAMAISQAGELIDLYGGRTDLAAGIVRAVGDPNRRFAEDALRLLRAVRFANRLNFELESETRRAIIAQAHLIKNVSKERIGQEFCRILQDNPWGVKDLFELGLLDYMWPDLAAIFNCGQEGIWHLYKVGDHSLKTAEYRPDLEFRLLALLHDLGKPRVRTVDQLGHTHFYGHAAISAELAEPILKDLAIAKQERRRLTALIRYHDYRSCRKSKLARLVRNYDREFFDLLFDLKRADILAQAETGRQAKLDLVENQAQLVQQLLAGPTRLSDLKIKGNDLKSLGYRGPDIGKKLEQILAYVMEDPVRNRREHLLNWARPGSKQDTRL